MLGGSSGVSGAGRKARLAAVAALTAVVGIAAYSAGRDHGGRELAVLRAAAGVNLPAAAGDARSAAAELRRATAEFSALLADNSSYQALKAEAARLHLDNIRLKAEAEAAAEALADTRGALLRTETALARTRPQTGAEVLEVGLAPTADRGVLAIGLIGTYDGFAVLSINGGRYTVKAGQQMAVFGADGSRCHVGVVGTGPEQTSVTARCDDSASP